MKLNAKIVLLLSTVAVLVSSCTKERPLKFLDSELRDGLVKKELVSESLYSLKTSEEKAPSIYDESKSWLAVNDQTSYKVEEADVPKKIKFMFKDLYLPLMPNQEYQVLLQSDRMGVTAYVLTQDLKSLSLIQQQLAKPYEKDASYFKVPVFYYNIRNYGRPQAIKNELEEETNSARLASTDWEQATHVFLAPTATERRPIGLIANSQRDWERVFLADLMLNVQVKAKDLKDYRITTGLPDTTDVVLKTEGEELLVFEVASTSSSLLTPSDLELIKSGKESDRLRKCTGIKNLSIKQNCVLIGRFKVPVSRVEADRSVVDRGGELGDAVIFRADQNLNNLGLLRIAENPTPIDFSPTETWDPRFFYKVSDLLGKKFYLRRTVQDVPRQLELFYSGEAGPMMLVEFVKREGLIVVKKVAQTVKFSNPSTTDIETVMSFGADYFRAETTDSAGRKLSIPRLVPTAATDNSANVVVKLNWSNPSVRPAGSPLGVDAFSAGACFNPGNDFRVENLNNKLNQADRSVLSFTLDGTYSFNPGMVQYCFGSMPGIAAWGTTWGNLDSNFNIKERISFYQHKAEDDNFKSLNIPYEAQKSFGAGFISRPKVVPSAEGITGFQEQVEENILIHDFKPGKKEVWYLVGLPLNYQYKDQIVDMTRKVFADMNEKFRRAFKGTPKETNQDIFEVRIVGVDTNENIVVGDQDKNIIVYEARETNNGFLGVYQGSGSPVNGKYINGNVVVFGGNTISNIAYMQWAAKIRMQYRSIYNSVVNKYAAAEKIDIKAAPQADTKPSSMIGFLRGILSKLSAKPAETKDSVANPSEMIKSLIPKFDNSTNQNLLPQVASNFGINKSFLKKTQNAKGLSDIIDVNKIGKNLNATANTGTLNISKLFDQALSNGQITKEQYGYTIVQRVVDRVVAERGTNALVRDKDFVDYVFVDEFLKSPPLEVSQEQILEMQAEHAKVAFKNTKQNFYKSTGVPHCFNEAPPLEDSVFETMTVQDIFKNMYAHTLEHELLHNMGLEHQFEGSYDGKNFEFEGESVGRLTSGLMEYGGMLDRATWRGMGPHDVHAIRLAYTGYVELESGFASAVKKESPGKVRLKTNDGREFNLPVKNDKLISILDLKNIVFADTDWNEFSEDLIRYASPVKLKHFEYCTNRDLGLDATCAVFDTGTNVPEIVTNMINEHWQGYWISNFENNRYRYGIMNLINNFYRSYYTFYSLRTYTDALMARMYLQGRGRNFEQPQDYDDQINLELFEASKITRDYILSFIKTPDPANRFDIGLNENVFTPFSVSISYDDGTSKNSVGIAEARSSYSIASSDLRFARIGNYLDKLAAMEMLTMKMASRSGMLNNDLAVPSSYSFLEFEKYLLGIEDPMESPSINLLKEFIMEDAKPMALVGSTRSIPIELDSSFGTIEYPNALSFTASKAAVLNTYSNALLDEYNFSNLFRVYSVRGRMPEELSGYSSVVDLTYDHDTQSQRRFFADGGSDSIVANAIINQNNIYRVLMDRKSKLTKDLSAYVSSIINTNLILSRSQTSDVKALAEFNSNLLKLKQVVMADLQEELSFSPELAAAYIEPLVDLKQTLPDVAQGITSALAADDQRAVNNVVDQVNSLAFRNPFAYSAIAYYIQDLKAKNQSSVVGNFTVEMAEQVFNTEIYTLKYSSTKSNLDMMNLFFSFIEPSARNR